MPIKLNLDRVMLERRITLSELADRIGIIDRGTLMAYGTMTELRAQAASDGNLEDLFMKITEEAAAEAAKPVAPAV